MVVFDDTGGVRRRGGERTGTLVGAVVFKSFVNDDEMRTFCVSDVCCTIVCY